MCSEGKVRRKTTWMCAVCEVPLCTRPLMDEDPGALTHMMKWHSVRDLISEHKKCHDELKNGRETRKRARGDIDGPGDEEVETVLKDETTEQV